MGFLSDGVLDLVANLSRRVASLERQVESLSDQLRDTQGNVERQAEELAEVSHVLKRPSPWATQEDLLELDGKVEMALDDIVTLDERTQRNEVEAVTFDRFLEVAERLTGGGRR